MTISETTGATITRSIYDRETVMLIGGDCAQRTAAGMSRIELVLKSVK